MAVLPEPLVFQWDSGNQEKNIQKHGIQNTQTEEAFFNPNIVIPDEGHGREEARYGLLGKTNGDKTVFVIFTIRNNAVRVISSRMANKKERKTYGQAFEKNSTI